LKYGGVTDLEHTFAKLRCPKGFGSTLRAFKQFAAGEVSWYMLLAYGGTGNGKTLCCEALVIALYDQGIRAKRQKWSDVLRFTLKPAIRHRSNQPEYEEVFAALRNQRLLILDDVGAGSTGGPWEWGELEDIVDYRLEKRLPTVLTTNLDLKKVNPRLWSRFNDKKRCQLVYDEAADQRPLEAGK